MDVIIQPTTADAVKLAAKLMAAQVRGNPDSVIGLATGRTMEALYAELARMCREEKLDFSKTVTFNLDEYVGLPPADVNSYRYYMNSNLFDKINIKQSNTHLPNGVAKDPDQEGRDYEKAIAAAGGVDMQLLGIGRDGHVGFNEPLSSLASRTRPVMLTPETVAQNGPLFPKVEDMPRRAMTMGVGTIMDAKKLLMLVTGDEKANVIAAAIEGPVTSMISGSVIQLHPDAVVILDAAAAAKLSAATAAQCRWSFANDPRWESYR